jgi:hypothetical protein
LSRYCQDLAQQVHLKSFLKQSRASKKKKPPLIVDGKHWYVSTARLLDKENIFLTGAGGHCPLYYSLL